MTIRFHPISLLAGLALGAALLFILGAAQLAAPGTHLPRIRVDGIPSPSQMVRLVAADFPYTVPPSQTLVITGVGQLRTSGFGLTSAEVSVGINGQDQVYVSTMIGDPLLSGSTQGGKFINITPGLMAPAGAIVTATTPTPTFATAPFVILGYLAPL